VQSKLCGVRLIPLILGTLMLSTGVLADRLVEPTSATIAVRHLEVVTAEHRSAISVPQGVVVSIAQEAALARRFAPDITMSLQSQDELTFLVFTISEGELEDQRSKLDSAEAGYRRERVMATAVPLRRRTNQIDLRLAILSEQENDFNTALGTFVDIPVDTLVRMALDTGINISPASINENLNGADLLRTVMQREGLRGERTILLAEKNTIKSSIEIALFPSVAVDTFTSVTERAPVWPTIIIASGLANVLLGCWVAHWKLGLLATIAIGFIGAMTFSAAQSVLTQARAVEAYADGLKVPTSTNLTEAKQLEDDINSLYAATQQLIYSLNSRRLFAAQSTTWLIEQREAATALAQDLAAAAQGAAQLTKAISNLADNPPSNEQERSSVAAEIGVGLGTLRSTLLGRPGIDPGGLIPPLRESADRFQSKRAEVLNRTAGTVDALAGLAKLSETRGTYLVIASNPALSNSSTGASLRIGEARINDGSLTLTSLEETSNEPKSTVNEPIPGVAQDITDEDLERNVGYLAVSEIWSTLGMSSRFDATAKVAADIWTATTGTPVDGVIYLDVVAVAPLMGVAGDIGVGFEVLNARTVTEELLAPADDLGPLRTAASQRRIMIWSRDEVVQAGSTAMRTAGEVGPLDIGFLPSTLNPKIDPFLEISASIEAVCSSPSMVKLSLTTTLSHTLVASNSSFLGASDPLTSPNDYVGVTITQIPAAASDIEPAEPRNFFINAPDGPTRTVAEMVILAPGQGWKSTLSFSIPPVTALRLIPDAHTRPVKWTTELPLEDRADGTWIQLPSC
jgi:hypothetical protein